jgi:hypothetical protein
MAITNDQKQRYTLLSGTHMTGGIVYDAGDKSRNVIELTKTQAENLGDRVRLEGQTAEQASQDSEQESKVKDPNPNLSGGSAVPVNEKPNARADSTTQTAAVARTASDSTSASAVKIATTEESNAKLTSLLGGNLSDVESEINKIDSTSDLDTLAKLEQSGKQRSGVMKMIRERKEELK